MITNYTVDTKQNGLSIERYQEIQILSRWLEHKKSS